MTTINDGGPAFPMVSDLMGHAPGMSLRDWFAGLAMQGLCADPTNHDLFDGHDDAAKSAFQIADAMLEARAKGGAA